MSFLSWLRSCTNSTFLFDSNAVRVTGPRSWNRWYTFHATRSALCEREQCFLSDLQGSKLFNCKRCSSHSFSQAIGRSGGVSNSSHRDERVPLIFSISGRVRYDVCPAFVQACSDRFVSSLYSYLKVLRFRLVIETSPLVDRITLGLSHRDFRVQDVDRYYLAGCGDSTQTSVESDSHFPF